VVVTGVILAVSLVANLNDLPAVVHAAGTACEMRALGLMALRTLHDRDRGELPVCRTAAARFAARGFPLWICHV